MGKVISIGRAMPPFIWKQESAKEFARNFFRNHMPNHIEKLLQVFDNGRIEQRYLAIPFEWHLEPRNFKEKNDLFQDYFLRMGKESILKCLEKVNIHPEEIDQIVFVTNSGIVHHSLLSTLCKEINCRSDVRCTLLFGQACAGGAGGLARANDLLGNNPKGKVLLCCIESSSIVFSGEDTSSTNLVQVSLFGDGAVTVLLVGDELAEQFHGPSIIASESSFIPNSERLVHIGIGVNGFEGAISRDLPKLLEKNLVDYANKFLRDQEICFDQITNFIVHPGGKRILEVIAEKLELNQEEDLRHSWEILRTHGNVMSTTVLLVLDEAMKNPHDHGELGLMLAFGPGVTVEQVLLRW